MAQGKKTHPAVARQILAMRVRRCSYRTISAILGVSTWTVYRHAPPAEVRRLQQASIERLVGAAVRQARRDAGRAGGDGRAGGRGAAGF